MALPGINLDCNNKTRWIWIKIEEKSEIFLNIIFWRSSTYKSFEKLKK